MSAIMDFGHDFEGILILCKVHSVYQMALEFACFLIFVWRIRISTQDFSNLVRAHRNKLSPNPKFLNFW